MTHEPTVEDIAAFRDEGTLVDFLLLAAGRSRKRSTAPDDTAPSVVGLPASPLHRPGAWPAGTRPAGPATCHPDCDCALIKPEEP